MLVFSSAFTQENSSSFLYGTDWLAPSEAKKWTKTLNGLNEADKLLNKSNENYLELGNIQSQEELSEKDKKQIEKLQSEADNLSLKSLELCKKVYLELNDILSVKFSDQDISHPSYTSWKDITDQATSLYSEANELDSYEKTSRLTQANEKQLQALKTGIEVFVLEPESVSEENVSTRDEYSGEDFVIDKELLQKYREYAENDNIPSPITATDLMGPDGIDASFGAFAEVWNNYQQGDFDIVNEPDLTMQDSLTQQVIAYNDTNQQERTIADQSQPTGVIVDKTIQTKESQGQENQTDNIQGTESQSQIEKSSDTKQEQKEITTREKPKTPDHEYIPEIPSGENLEFRVQVAASRIPLNISQIESIYSGNMSIVEIREEGYFKYQIRGYLLLSDAQTVCSQSDVENAYIEAYKGKDRIALGLAAKENRSLEQLVAQKGRERAMSPIIFAVQLGASRTRLSDQQVQNLSDCDNPVKIVFEGGLYKYQVFIGKHLESAFDYLEKCAEKESFIVAYKNGRKLKLHKAIQEYKTNTP